MTWWSDFGRLKRLECRFYHLQINIWQLKFKERKWWKELFDLILNIGLFCCLVLISLYDDSEASGDEVVLSWGSLEAFSDWMWTFELDNLITRPLGTDFGFSEMSIGDNGARNQIDMMSFESIQYLAQVRMRTYGWTNRQSWSEHCRILWLE